MRGGAARPSRALGGSGGGRRAAGVFTEDLPSTELRQKLTARVRHSRSFPPAAASDEQRHGSMERDLSGSSSSSGGGTRQVGV